MRLMDAWPSADKDLSRSFLWPIEEWARADMLSVNIELNEVMLLRPHDSEEVPPL